jgi:hypothetical protein
MSSSPSQVDMGQNFTVVVRASDNVGVTSLTLTANGVPLALVPTATGAGGTATLNYPTAGPIDLVATATDAAGNQGTADKTVMVIDPSVTDSPTTTITSPSESADVTAPIPIMGTVSDPQNALSSWTLTMTPDSTPTQPANSPAKTPPPPRTGRRSRSPPARRR